MPTVPGPPSTSWWPKSTATRCRATCLRAAGAAGYVFSEVSIPARALVFDVFVHEDLYPGAPELRLYDTALHGVADINDPSRDIDRLDMIESVQALGRGGTRVSEAPLYVDAVGHVFESMGWNEGKFRTYRTRIDYPLYGSQVAFVFEPSTRRAPQ